MWQSNYNSPATGSSRTEKTVPNDDKNSIAEETRFILLLDHFTR